jgi:hypothetical protein
VPPSLGKCCALSGYALERMAIRIMQGLWIANSLVRSGVMSNGCQKLRRVQCCLGAYPDGLIEGRKALAARLRVDYSYLVKVLGGEREPSAELVKKVKDLRP